MRANIIAQLKNTKDGEAPHRVGDQRAIPVAPAGTS
jgi:hypothetical protein